MMRLLRLLVAQAERAGSTGVMLTRDGALHQTARRMLDASPEERGTTRTAWMALRDLVWRFDSVRSMLSPHAAEPAVAGALRLRGTSDIHLFLRQEP
jgi:hypothetical protein